jgi:ABC-type glycerol-3-phosphate transport system permease component
MLFLKTWLKDANGWQRLWFVASVTGYVYFCVFMPLNEVGKSSSYRYQVLSNIHSEMKKPECATYMNLPFDQLAEPPFPQTTEGCYYIYNHRQFSEKKQPVTPKSVDEKFAADHRQNLLEWFLVGFVFSTISTALLYFLGAITAWIIKGFRKKEL